MKDRILFFYLMRYFEWLEFNNENKMKNQLFMQRFVQSIPIPQSSSGLSGNALISWEASAFSHMKTSIPWLIHQTKQIIFVFMNMLILLIPLVCNKGLLCPWSLELWSSLVCCWDWLTCDKRLNVWCSLNTHWLHVWCTIFVHSLLLNWRNKTSSGSNSPVIVHLWECLSVLGVGHCYL